MKETKQFIRLKPQALALLCVSLGLMLSTSVLGQNSKKISEAEYGPVMSAYLGYLRSEQEVVDDRASRHEIDAAYYRHNSSRIRALRLMAIRIVRETGNDYVPELEAVTQSELRNLFERPPSVARLQVGRVVGNVFRFLGAQRVGEVFYLFARLDPYEQAEPVQKTRNEHADRSTSELAPVIPARAITRRRRAVAP